MRVAYKLLAAIATLQVLCSPLPQPLVMPAQPPTSGYQQPTVLSQICYWYATVYTYNQYCHNHTEDSYWQLQPWLSSVPINCQITKTTTVNITLTTITHMHNLTSRTKSTMTAQENTTGVPGNGREGTAALTAGKAENIEDVIRYDLARLPDSSSFLVYVSLRPDTTPNLWPSPCYVSSLHEKCFSWRNTWLTDTY